MKAKKILMWFSVAMLISGCSSEEINDERHIDNKVVTEEDLIREAEEILNSDEETYWDFSDPKNLDKIKGK